MAAGCRGTCMEENFAYTASQKKLDNRHIHDTLEYNESIIKLYFTKEAEG
jgi:hypothetical protein